MQIADRLKQPDLKLLIRRYLHDQLFNNDGDEPAADLDPEDLPRFNHNVALHHSASATFYAPSEECGTGGMHCEMIRSNPAWYGKYPRYDTVLVQNGPEDEGEAMGGMLVGRAKAFLSFKYQDVIFKCALMEWFIPHGTTPDPLTGMWIVKPEVRRGKKTVDLVDLDCLVRACHLMPVFHRDIVPVNFHFSNSLDAFEAYYVNHYIDYHSHECLPRG